MFDSNSLNSALRNCDSAQVVAVLKDQDLTDLNVARKFVTLLRQSSCLVIQICDPKLEQRRDALVIKCRELLETCGDASIIEDFEHHVEDARVVEFGYREIFRTIHASEISKHHPSEQAWGVLHRADGEFRFVRDAIDKELSRIAKENKAPLDARQLKIQCADGGWTSPDAMINGIVGYVGDTLITLAYGNQWFEKDTGNVVLPDEVKVDDAIGFKAGNFALAASEWKCLEHAWDRSRLYGARFRLREQEFPVNEGGTRLAKVLEVTEAKDVEVKDQIAQQRLQQVFFQHQKDLDLAGKLEGSASTNCGSVPLAVAGYLCPEEQVAIEVLSRFYHLPMDDETVVFGGLPAKAWMRGYAHYVQLAKGPDGEHNLTNLRISKEDLISGLVSAGLTEDQAQTFVGLTTFGRGVADLFEAPLLKIRDGSYLFCAPAYHAPVLGVIFLSRIAWLNRRRNDQGEPANDSVFEDKGKAFEKHVVEMFSEAQIVAGGFKYKIGTTEYDCDAAALIDDTLFVFECKNRSLPMGHLPSLYYFMLALREAQIQVKRIAKQFTDHPEIVRQNLGLSAKWNRIVPVVLHALPWSFGSSDGVYTFDGSALSHILNTGFTSVIAEFKVGDLIVHRRHRYPLCKGAIPTAKELEREMENPNQLRLHVLGWEQQVHPVQISENVVFALPRWSQRNATLKEQLMALGSSDQEAEAVAKEMSSNIPAKLDDARFSNAEPKSGKKIGRNDPCPCNSGKKYKKCCLRRGA